MLFLSVCVTSTLPSLLIIPPSIIIYASQSSCGATDYRILKYMPSTSTSMTSLSLYPVLSPFSIFTSLYGLGGTQISCINTLSMTFCEHLVLTKHFCFKSVILNAVNGSACSVIEPEKFSVLLLPLTVSHAWNIYLLSWRVLYCVQHRHMNNKLVLLISTTLLTALLEI